MAAETVDLLIHSNAMDDSGLPWAFLDNAADPVKVRRGHYLLVGSGAARAVAVVVDVTDGVVHVRLLRGSVAANTHLLGGTSKAS